MRLTKLERKRNQQQSYQNTFRNEYEYKGHEQPLEHDKVDIVPENAGVEQSM